MRYVQDGQATHHYPEDTDKEMWIEDNGGLTVRGMIERCQAKWPEVPLENINITPVNHHQYNIYYDLYDYSDYVHYLVFSV